MSTIRFDKVTKIYPGTGYAAVDACSFTIEEGSLVVLLGPSGCGKTTLLKMVNRLVEPTMGSVYLNGVDVQTMEGNTLRRRIGYVIQQVGLFPHMTVAENISIVPRLLGWPEAKIRARVDELLDLVRLPPGEFCTRYPSQLSGGQQQRVGVARGLAGDPQVLLMDEPFGAIDALTRASLQKELHRLQSSLKKTILFVTHDVEEALYLADWLVVLNRGRVLQVDTPLRVLTHPADDFVSRLVGAEDMVRQLSQVRVETAMQPLPLGWEEWKEPAVAAADNLRHALSMLLRTGVGGLIVTNDQGPVGRLTLECIRASTHLPQEADR
jgi:osmoprotectant transport system ATP-binding protein